MPSLMMPASSTSARHQPRAFGVAALAATLLASAVWAQEAPVRVRGTIESVDGSVYVVKSRDGTQLKLKLPADVKVSSIVPAKLTDIKQGSYIGVAGMPQADGSQKALEVSIFPEALRGLAEGFRPWDLVPKSTMTNANVDAQVTSANGQTLTLKYKDGEKKIIVPSGTPVVAFAPGSASDLKPGAKIFIGAAKKHPDGTLEADRVNVGKGTAPPM